MVRVHHLCSRGHNRRQPDKHGSLRQRPDRGPSRTRLGSAPERLYLGRILELLRSVRVAHQCIRHLLWRRGEPRSLGPNSDLFLVDLDDYFLLYIDHLDYVDLTANVKLLKFFLC